MNIFGTNLLQFLRVLLFLSSCHVISEVKGQDELPNVIIGDPNEALNDIIGDPISDAEIEESLKNLDITEGHNKIFADEQEITDYNNTATYFQGDIIIPTEDILYELIQGDPNHQLSAIRNRNMLWPSGVIPYTISSTYNSYERSVIARAMAEYQSKTCIRFVPRSNHRDYIHIIRGSGCSSQVGRTGGVQYVSLATNCVHFGTVLHELMHAAGFWHEQSRYDRDSYVTIYWQNIWNGMQFNFNKKSNTDTSDLGLPYDYDSVMHYGPYAFSRGHGLQTIAAKKAGARFGHQSRFSQLDIQSLNKLYSCTGITPKPGPNPTGCADVNENCASWASKGQCRSNPAYMLISCRKSCDNCDKCRDTNQYCADWASKGYCKSNPGYMLPNCKKSCDNCEGGGGGGGKKDCRDIGKFCKDWASKGECDSNPKYMHVNCKLSCKKCDDTTGTNKDCKDIGEHCEDWSRKGECESNAAYMKDNCQKSCKLCDGDSRNKNCKDIGEHCKDWSSKGECDSNPEYMKENCKLSCNLCDDDKTNKTNCVDTGEHCEDWSRKGECENNPEYMRENCQASCNLCDETTTTAPTTTTEEPSTSTSVTEVTEDGTNMTTTEPPTTATPIVTEDCQDDHIYCEDWAAKGECTKNEGYMKESCQFACKICVPVTVTTTTESMNITTTTENPDCQDKNEFCEDWASKGECETNEGFMKVGCRKSCGLC